MVTFITTIHIIVCVLLIIIVLLQQGKSEMGASFGGGSTQSVFGARGAASALSKITTGAAITFMITSLSLAYLSSKESTKSLLKDDAPKAEQVTPTPGASVTPTTTDETKAAAPVENPEPAATPAGDKK